MLAAAGLSGSIAGAAAAPIASAQGCPDVEVLFARGTGEDPGVGPTGQAFVDNLRGRIGGKSMDVYPINYPATQEWQTGLDGIRDAGAHVESTAASCPQTKMVLSLLPRRGRDGLRHLRGSARWGRPGDRTETAGARNR